MHPNVHEYLRTEQVRCSTSIYTQTEVNSRIGRGPIGSLIARDAESGVCSKRMPQYCWVIHRTVFLHEVALWLHCTCTTQNECHGLLRRQREFSSSMTMPASIAIQAILARRQ